MSTPVSETSIKLLRKLIVVTTGFQENSDIFEKTERKIILEVEKSDSMCFKNREEMDKITQSLSDKFLFHGLKPQANDLISLYNKFMDEISLFYDASNKRSIVRFIIAMAESPTNNYYKFPRHTDTGDNEDNINWAEYLQEGIPKWSLPAEETESDWSDDSDITFDNESKEKVNDSDFHFKPIGAKGEQTKSAYDIYCESRKMLLESVQHDWFNSENVQQKPISQDREANIAFLWDDYVSEVTGGLIPEVRTNIISEYKVIRELLWQFYEPTNSFCFEFQGDHLVLKSGITIASVREFCFQTVISKFLPYIEMLQNIKEFQCSVGNFDIDTSKSTGIPPDTYRCYTFALKDILVPVYLTLKEIEDEVQAQEKISTLITVSQRLRPAFKVIELVKKVHDKVVIDFNVNSRLFCASALLARLNMILLHCSDKTEQDVVLTMYLESLKKYLGIIEAWLGTDTFNDFTREFIIEEEERDSKTSISFRVKELDEFTSADRIIIFICTEVLRIGKNVHLLRLFGKAHLVKAKVDADVIEKSLHEDFVDAVLEEIAHYFKSPDDSTEEEKSEKEPDMDIVSPRDDKGGLRFKYPIYFGSNNPTDFDRLENLVDTTDGFLVMAFKEYFLEDNEPPPVEKESIYQRVVRTTKGLCPIQQILENVLVKLIEERFSVSGTLVKHLLISDYKLGEYFKLLKHLFLFQDDLIFPFYGMFFKEINSNFEINELNLTNQLQDLLMDVYPHFFESCRVELKKNWDQCKDALKLCTFLKVHTTIAWPVSLIIQEEHLTMYLAIFQFVLKIKWALYTLNRLSFTDLEPKAKSSEKPSRLVQRTIAKLKILRFVLVNNLSSIQHYVLGYVYNKYENRFRQEFADSYDFETLFEAHNNFITGLYKECIEFRDFQVNDHGFYLVGQ